MDVINLKSYKVAKEYAKDSEEFLKVIDLSIRALSFYNKYKPVSSILYSLKDNKAILEAHLNTAKKIIKSSKVGDK